MKTLIYQYWLGKIEPCAKVGKIAMEEYAKKIGAEYRFDMNPKFISKLTNCASHMSALRPVFDKEFHKYDKVMYVDCDIFPVDGIKENIFECNTGEMAICEEPHQPKMRQTLGRETTEKKWASRVEQLYGKKMPKNDEGLYKVFNSGLVIYSKTGMEKAIDTFIPMQKFINDFRPHFDRPLYYRDQAYVHAMLEVGNMDWRQLDNKWNSQIHWMPETKPDSNGMRPVYDGRNKHTNFVHVQLTGSGNWGKDKLWQVVNLPQHEWRL